MLMPWIRYVASQFNFIVLVWLSILFISSCRYLHCILQGNSSYICYCFITKEVTTILQLNHHVIRQGFFQKLNSKGDKLSLSEIKGQNLNQFEFSRAVNQVNLSTDIQIIFIQSAKILSKIVSCRNTQVNQLQINKVYSLQLCYLHKFYL